MNIELKGVKFVKGHDDSQPFTGTMYVNGKKCAELYDDGWGGGCQINAVSGMSATLDAVYEYAKSLPQVECFGTKIDMNLDILIGELCEPIFKELDNKKMETKMNRLTKFNLVFVHGNNYVSYKYKNEISLIAAKRPDIIEACIATAKLKYPEYVLYNKL